jgi:plastocyanin
MRCGVRKSLVLGTNLCLLLVMAGCGTATFPTAPHSDSRASTLVFDPAPTSLSVGQTVQFTVSASHAPHPAAIWSVAGIRGGNSTVGTISSTGVYTAPATAPNPPSVVITAATQGDSTDATSIQVTISADKPADVAISILSPLGPASVTVGQTLPITATVTGAPNTAVNWTVTGALSGTAANGNATLGTIAGTSPSAIYTAPSALPSGNNPVTITATSQADPSQSASLTVAVNPSTAHANAVNVPGGNTDATDVNIDIASTTPTLGLADVGTCGGTLASTSSLTSCSGGVASVTIMRGSTAIVWLLGQGLTDNGGTTIANGLSVDVSQGTHNDVTVTQLTPLTPTDNHAGLLNVAFQVTVNPNATPGPRNIIVTNSATGELQAFVGAIQIQ